MDVAVSPVLLVDFLNDGTELVGNRAQCLPPQRLVMQAFHVRRLLELKLSVKFILHPVLLATTRSQKQRSWSRRLSTWGCTCAQRAGKSHKHDLLWAFDHNDVAPSGIDGHRWHTCHAELLGSLNWWTIFKEFINIPLLPLFSRFAFFSQSTDHHPTQPGSFEAYLQTKNLKTRSPQ